MKVTVLGAAGGVGQPLSLLLKLNLPAGSELSLFDISPLIKGVAADLSHIPTLVKVRGYTGNDLDKALQGSDIVTIPAGLPRKPGMTRDDLLAKNAAIIDNLLKEAAKVCPDACIAIIANPVDTLVPIAAKIMKKFGVGNPRKLFGVSALDTLRAKAFIADIKEVNPDDLSVVVIGGHSEKTILPLFSKLEGIELSEDEIEKLTKHVRNAGTEIVEAKAGAGSATLSTAAAGSHFVMSLVRALSGEKNVIETAYVQTDGKYAPFFSQPILLGVNGVEEILPIDEISQYEQELLDELLPIQKNEIEEAENIEL